MNSPGETQQCRNTHDLKESENEAVLLTTKTLSRLYIWEILHSTIRKMDKHVQKIQQELEEAKDKLEKQQHKRVTYGPVICTAQADEKWLLKGFWCVCCQRDSGDDEDMDKASEDEEGQLEEQIERLQEKVESAQSEQKNLFLVIFQVFVFIFSFTLNTLTSFNMFGPYRSASSCC